MMFQRSRHESETMPYHPFRYVFRGSMRLDMQEAMLHAVRRGGRIMSLTRSSGQGPFLTVLLDVILFD